jgi:hypothetical protein
VTMPPPINNPPSVRPMMAFGESLVTSGKADRSRKSFMMSVGDRGLGGSVAGAVDGANGDCFVYGAVPLAC